MVNKVTIWLREEVMPEQKQAKWRWSEDREPIVFVREGKGREGKKSGSEGGCGAGVLSQGETQT